MGEMYDDAESCALEEMARLEELKEKLKANPQRCPVCRVEAGEAHEDLCDWTDLTRDWMDISAWWRNA